ncbi:MAG: GEVED domain-containing protein [Rikenellaceae bacterium]
MKINLKLLVLSLFLMFGMLRCSTDDITEVGNKNDILGGISLNTENIDIFIKESDVVSPFTIKAKKAFDKDVAIKLSVDVSGASLPVSKIVIPAGKTEVTGEIKFNKDMFDGSTKSLISVVLSAESDDVSLTNVKIVYDVRRYIYGAPEVSLLLDSSQVEVWSADVPVKVIIKSDAPFTEDVTFAVSSDGGKENVDYTLTNKSVTIRKGEREGFTTLTLLRSSFVGSNTDRPGDKAMDIGVKIKTDAKINIIKSTAIINAIGGFFVKTYCFPYMVSIASHYMHTFTIGSYTLDPPHLASELHYYEDLRNSNEKKIGKIEVPTGVSPLTFVTESKPGYGSASNLAVAWIDWNADGDFSDDGEFVAKIPYVAKIESNGAKYSVDVNTPSFVKPGFSTTMRIGVIDTEGDKMTRSGGCGGASQGDVVDVRIYIVKGVDVIPFTGSLSNETISVTGADVSRTIVVTFPSEVEDDTEVSISVTGGNSTHYKLSSNKIIVPRGSKTGSATITFKKEFFQVALQNEDFNIELKPLNPYLYKAGSGTKAKFNVSGVGTKPTAFIDVTSTDVTVAENTDKIVPLKITLSEPDNTKDVNVAINAGVGFEDMVLLSAKSVTIPKGQTSVSLSATFKSSYFPFKGDVKKVPITITSSNVIIDSKKGTLIFSVQGSAIKPALVAINTGASYTTDVTGGDFTVSSPFWTKGKIMQDVQVVISFAGENAAKAKFEDGTTSKILTFEADGNNSVTEYFTFIVKQSAFVRNQKGQTVTMSAKAYGKSNIDFGGGATSKEIVWAVDYREAGTYCPIQGSGDDEFYISSIRSGGKTINGGYTDVYTDLSSQIFDMSGSVFEMDITVHKDSSVPNGTYELAVFIDATGDLAFTDYWSEFMQLQKEDGSGSATNRTAILMDKDTKTFKYKGQYDLSKIKSRVRIALTRDANSRLGTSPVSGCMVGEEFNGTVVDVSWRKN